MSPNKAEFMAGVSGTATFFTTLFALALPWWLSLVLTALVYLGFNLLFGGRLEQRVRQAIGGGQVVMAEMRQRVAASRQTVNNLKKLARRIESQTMRTKVLDVCTVAEKIFANFDEDPDDIRHAHRFLSHFQKLLPIVENYVHLSSDPDRRQVLTAEDESGIAATLDELHRNLKDAYQAYQENNLQKLRLATGTLKRMIEMENAVKRK